ncbi:hypothetical protein CLOM_g20127 [Closterium sp. NIES-68]|nr:hypothetical protein CLOM_g20127 [Closterium sp. NIES-68]GJP68101.1 hypothetical protein CLOP_g24848 [Closterium sp. NIES-67]
MASPYTSRISGSPSLLRTTTSPSRVPVFSSFHAHTRNPSISPPFAFSRQNPLSLNSRFAVPSALRNARRFSLRSSSEDPSSFTRRALAVAAVTGAGASIPIVFANRSRPFGNRLENIDGRSYYVVERGDSLSAISRTFGTSVDVIAQANNLQTLNIQPGQSLWIPRMYTIQKGDTLYGIARKFSTTVAGILEINRIDDPNVIQADDVILIP